ncbi:MAG: hypothetical protein AABY15_00180 [Nanoarchaeota archaeon]
MKVIEQTISPKKTKTEIVLKGNKKFIRISREKFNGIQMTNSAEWRRFKTNHQVKKDENESLEKEYSEKFPKRIMSPDLHFAGKNLMGSGSTEYHAFVPNLDIKDDEVRREVEKGLVEASENGKLLLAGVKYVKNKTGWGLKESKEFVDAFFERKKKFVGVGVSERGLNSKKIK